MFKPKIRHFLEHECEKIVDRLKMMSVDELQEKGKTLDTEIAYSDGRKAQISVIVKSESPERLLVVVHQCFMPMTGIMGWLGVKHVNVDGFRRDANGRIEKLDNKTIWEYD